MTRDPESPESENMEGKSKSQTSQMPRMGGPAAAVVQVISIKDGIAQHQGPQRHRKDAPDMQRRFRVHDSGGSADTHDGAREAQAALRVTRRIRSSHLPLRLFDLLAPESQVADRARDGRAEDEGGELEGFHARRVRDHAAEVEGGHQVAEQVEGSDMGEGAREDGPPSPFPDHFIVVDGEVPVEGG